MRVVVPELALVVLIGASGSGKSTFARQHFRPTEILSSDAFRAMIADDENDQSVSREAFDILYRIVEERLARQRLTVLDATNVQAAYRRQPLLLAREHHCPAVAVVLDLPHEQLLARHHQRRDRDFEDEILDRQHQQLRQQAGDLRGEGFDEVYVLRTPEEVAAVQLERRPMPSNRKAERGPFDLIGDVHGCFDELLELLEKLGYAVVADPAGGYRVAPPPGRKIVFVGDLVDRGPKVHQVLELAMDAAEDGQALCVLGNHDWKLLRKLKGHNVQIAHGLAETLEQLASRPPAFSERVRFYLEGLPDHLVLDEGRLVVAHAGLKESLQGRYSKRVRDFALYGDTTGRKDQYGLPERLNWGERYAGEAVVVYGHTPVAEPHRQNVTVNIDTGCVFGGSLTALRYPEQELVSVPAHRVYYETAKPFLAKDLPPPPDETSPPAASAWTENC